MRVCFAPRSRYLCRPEYIVDEQCQDGTGTDEEPNIEAVCFRIVGFVDGTLPFHHVHDRTRGHDEDDLDATEEMKANPTRSRGSEQSSRRGAEEQPASHAAVSLCLLD